MAYKRGQEVFRDPKPFVYCVQPNYRKVVCDWCLKMCQNEGIIKACTRCNWVYYCNQNCQKEAWNSHHKSECKYLQKQNMPQLVKEHFDGNCHDIQLGHLKMLKTILKLKNSGREDFFQLPNGKRRYFTDLMSNAHELRKQKEQMNQSKEYVLQYAVFKTWIGDAMPSFTDYFEIMGKWQTNATSISAMNFCSPVIIASGLYLGYSSFDHSCAPNASWINVGKEMVVRAIEDVENLSEIRISYFDCYEKTQKRRRYLRERYFFDCKCVRCEDPNSDAKFSALKCKSCPGWVIESSKICSSCHQTLKLSDEEFTTVEKYKNGTLPKFEPAMPLKEIKSLLEKYTKIFHGFHEIFRQSGDVIEFLILRSQYKLGNLDTIRLFLELRKLKLNFLSGHLPQFHQDFGYLHFLNSFECTKLKLFDEAKFHMKKAEIMMKVAFGEEHPYTQECQECSIAFQSSIVAMK